MLGVKRTRASTRTLPSLLCFPDDILLELVTQLDFACLYKTLLALCAVCRKTRSLYSGTATLNALCAKHCTLWGLRTVPIGLDAMTSASLPLRRLHLGAQRWASGFKTLFEIAPDEYGARHPACRPLLAARRSPPVAHRVWPVRSQTSSTMRTPCSTSCRRQRTPSAPISSGSSGMCTRRHQTLGLPETAISPISCVVLAWSGSGTCATWRCCGAMA